MVRSNAIPRGLIGRSLAIIVALAVVLTGLVFSGASRADALSGSDFNAGYIISDQNFFNKNSMTEAQIQAFLNSKVSSCKAGYTCLRDYTEATNTRAAGSCAEYDGAASENAATIIYRVAQACGINPQVILVTLQKEEGLVTSTAPSAAVYQKAMGYGCADSSACVALYYGFFNQVYDAAHQFLNYGANPTHFNYRIGRFAVKYAPTGCLAPVINILNQATADLYDYTPYQPDPPALANLTGTGDGCSSYGNRNFWVYYNTWFGPSTDPGFTAILIAYENSGSDTGPLGAVTNPTAAYGGGQREDFANGSIFWSPGTGAFIVSGAELAAYLAAGDTSGSLGWPTSSIVTEAVNGGGSGQVYQGGSIYSSPAGSFIVSGAIRTAYWAAGGEASNMGWPTGAQTAVTGGFSQTFAGGSIFWSSTTGARILSGGVLATYTTDGGAAGGLGLPTSGLILEPTVSGGGSGQVFQNGSIYSSAAGAFAVSGAIRAFYWSQGGEGGALGWPSGAQTTLAGGGLSQAFQHGTIEWTAAQGAHIALTGAFESAYVAAGGGAVLGNPASGVIDEPSVNGGGSGQVFQGGSIYVSAAGGFAVMGSIRAAYWAAGGEAGPLAWPTGVQTVVTGGLEQSFSGGTILWTATGGARVVSGAVSTTYVASGGPGGSLGFPTSGLISEPTISGGGAGQVFQSGSIYASPAGAFIVSGAVRTFYWAHGGESGLLGWPTSPATTTATGLTQSFQGGVILWTAAGGASIALTAPFQAAYDAAGGAAVLGAPTSGVIAEPTVNGGGSGQVFQGGSIYVSPAGGFALAGAIRSAYWAAGGETGVLAWPTGAATAIAGGYSQAFTGGTIFYSAKTGAKVVTGGELTAYSSAGGPSGALGWPTSALIPEPTVRGGGSGQVFQGGSIYVSPVGGFVVSDPVRTFYWSQGGEAGPLGWPTSAASAITGGVTQSFQGGSIVWTAAGGAHLAP